MILQRKLKYNIHQVTFMSTLETEKVTIDKLSHSIYDSQETDTIIDVNQIIQRR